MTALEFEAQIKPDGTVAVPPAVAEQVPAGQVVRVLLLIPETVTEDQEWARLATDQFLKGYDEGDAIYTETGGEDGI